MVFISNKSHQFVRSHSVLLVKRIQLRAGLYWKTFIIKPSTECRLAESSQSNVFVPGRSLWFITLSRAALFGKIAKFLWNSWNNNQDKWKITNDGVSRHKSWQILMCLWINPIKITSLSQSSLVFPLMKIFCVKFRTFHRIDHDIDFQNYTKLLIYFNVL